MAAALVRFPFGLGLTATCGAARIMSADRWTGFWSALRGISRGFLNSPPHKPHSAWPCGGIWLGGHACDAYNAYRCVHVPTGDLHSRVGGERGDFAWHARRLGVGEKPPESYAYVTYRVQSPVIKEMGPRTLVTILIGGVELAWSSSI